MLFRNLEWDALNIPSMENPVLNISYTSHLKRINNSLIYIQEWMSW